MSTRFTKRQEAMEQAKKLLVGEVGYKSFGIGAVLALLVVAEVYFLYVAGTMLSSNIVTMIAAIVGSIISAFSTWYVFRAKLYAIPQKTTQSKIAIGLLLVDATIIALNTWLATIIAGASVNHISIEQATGGNQVLEIWHQACTSVPIIAGFIGWPVLLMFDPDKKRQDHRLKAEQEKQDLNLDHDMAVHEASIAMEDLQLELDKMTEEASLSRARIEKEAELKRLAKELEAEIKRKEQEHEAYLRQMEARMAKEAVEQEYAHQKEMLKIAQEREMNEAVMGLQNDAIRINAKKVREKLLQYTPYLDESADEAARQAFEKITGKRIVPQLLPPEKVVDGNPRITKKLEDLHKKENEVPSSTNSHTVQEAGQSSPTSSNNSQIASNQSNQNQNIQSGPIPFKKRPRGRPTKEELASRPFGKQVPS